MVRFFKKILNRHFFLIFLLSLFFIISNTLLNNDLINNENITNIKFFKKYIFSIGDGSLFGTIESLILIFLLGINFFNRKCLIAKYNKYSYYMKMIFLSVLTYEEISFLTTNKFEFLGNFNNQNELNFHNSNLFNQTLFNQIPLIGDLGLSTISLTFLYLLIGYGSYFKSLNKFKIIFLERKNSFYSNLYLLNLGLSKILINLSFSDFYRFIFNNNFTYLYNFEFIEFTTYLVFLIDSIDKINSAKKLSIN